MHAFSPFLIDILRFLRFFAHWYWLPDNIFADISAGCFEQLLRWSFHAAIDIFRRRGPQFDYASFCVTYLAFAITGHAFTEFLSAIADIFSADYAFSHYIFATLRHIIADCRAASDTPSQLI
jgi:hypothetical protein